MSALSEYYLEKEKQLEDQKVIQKNNSNQMVDNNNPDNNITMAEAGVVGTVSDVAVSGVVGAADTITYLIDLPFMLTDALDKGGKFLFEKAADAAGFEQSETEEMEESYFDAIKKKIINLDQVNI